jgi:hypothetical protein
MKVNPSRRVCSKCGTPILSTTLAPNCDTCRVPLKAMKQWQYNEQEVVGTEEYYRREGEASVKRREIESSLAYKFSRVFWWVTLAIIFLFLFKCSVGGGRSGYTDYYSPE